MKILVLGGTAWLGHHIAATAISRGHEVTCLARGSAVPRGTRLVQADRDRDDAVASLAGERWDAVIDVARQPGHVRRAVRDLEAVSSLYVFVSSVSAYASHDVVGADETAELLPPLAQDRFENPDDYGSAKVACEHAVLDAFGASRSVVARAGLIAGPGDPTGRTVYWPWRFAHPAVDGTVLVPDAPDLPTSVIDVRDLAQWLVLAVENDAVGVFNATGPSVPLSDHLATARTAARSDALAVSAPDQWLADREVAEWAGRRSLPLWVSDRSWYGFGAKSAARAVEAGLTCRPLIETLRDGLVWRESAPADRDGAGLTDDDERALLSELTLRDHLDL